MNYYDIYKSRLKSYGENSEEAKINATIYSINRTFSDSIFSETVPVNGALTDTIINQGKTSSDKVFLFRPEYQGTKGMTIEFDGNVYLTVDFDRNRLYPSAKGKLCNNHIELKGETKQVQVGVGSKTGKPIYETIESPPLQIPCIAEKTITKSNTDEAINMPEGTILITIPYVEHEQLDIDKELVIYDTKYKIIDVDDTESINGVGLRRITGNRVV